MKQRMEAAKCCLCSRDLFRGQPAGLTLETFNVLPGKLDQIAACIPDRGDIRNEPLVPPDRCIRYLKAPIQRVKGDLDLLSRKVVTYDWDAFDDGIQRS